MIRYFITLCTSLLVAVFTVHAEFNPSKIIPADKSQVASLSTITVIWPGEWLDGVAPGQCGKVEDESGKQVATLTCEEDYGYENAACSLILSEIITTPGKYIVYVNANTALNEDGDEGNEAFTIQYEVVSASEVAIELVSANPEDNSTVASLSKIETYWSAKISVVNSDVTCEVLDDKGLKVSGVTVSKGIFSTDPIVFTLDETIKLSGKYTVNIPAGVLESEDGIKSEASTLTYTVSESATIPLLNPTEINPANYSVIGHLYKFTIAWDSEFDFGFDAKEVGKVTDEYNTTIASINCSVDWWDENTIVFTLSQPISAEGTYIVSIEAGKIIAANGAQNDDINLVYNIDPSKVEADLQYWVIPSDAKIEGDEFPDVEFEFDEKVELNITEFTFESDKHEKVTVNAALSYETVTLDCTPIKTPGVWTLTIPEGAFKSVETGNINPEKTYQWEFVHAQSGIGNIVDSDHKLSVSPGKIVIKGYDEVKIFDLNGKMWSNYHGNVSTTLQPGVYFIQCFEENKMTAYKILME